MPTEPAPLTEGAGAGSFADPKISLIPAARNSVAGQNERSTCSVLFSRNTRYSVSPHRTSQCAMALWRRYMSRDRVTPTKGFPQANPNGLLHHL
jgi:hypothetical protein